MFFTVDYVRDHLCALQMATTLLFYAIPHDAAQSKEKKENCLKL